MNDIPFRQIPETLREPLFYAEVDNSHANTSGPVLRTLLIGSKLAAGAATVNVPILSQGVADAKTQFGAGSQLALMVEAYRANDGFGEVWCLPVADDGAAVVAAGSISFTGPATAAGTLALYIGGQRVPVAVTSGMTAIQLATAVAAAVTAAVDLPVTAAVDGVTTYKVNFSAKNLGLSGNDIDIRVNYRGSAGGETTPAGIVPTIVAMVNGATNPVLTTALANLADEPFEFIAVAFNDATTRTAITAFLNDSAGRWSWQNQLYGHAFIGFRGTYGQATTLGQGLNDPHTSCLPMKLSPTPTFQIAAALTAQAAISVRADQAQPIRSVTLSGVLAPAVADRYTLSERNGLLFDGMSTFTVSQSGEIVLSKLVTTYQTNAFGSPDNSYLDAETLFNIAGILRRLKGVVTSKYGRSKLARDGSRLAPGSSVVTPKQIRGSMIAEYRVMEGEGLVQDSDRFAAALVVQANTQNPNRVDVLWPGILIGRMDIFALLAQFRLA